MAGFTPVAVVGGGPAALALARSFLRHGVPFEIFERHTGLGGLWDQDNPGTPIYDSAHFISSKTLSHFADYPMPDGYPDYPSHRQILAYIRDFADAYGLKEHVNLGVGVDRAEPLDAGWRLTLSTGETREFGSLVCASGTNWHPVMPDYPGEFTGDIRHSNTYRSYAEFAGKRVLIIGAGNSGCDIACDAAHSAQRAFISMRRGYHFIPKHVFGIPADVFGEGGSFAPMWLEQKAFGGMLRLLNGDYTRLGLQQPDHKVLESHPIINDQLLHYLRHGDITAKGDVDRFDGTTVHFTDGTHEEVDVVICATGYDWQIPYVPREEFDWRAGRPDLYLNLISRTNPRLYVAGYIETNGGAYKLFDETADLIVRTIAARDRDEPAAERLRVLAATDRQSLTGGIHHVNSPRHATYVESGAYRKKLGQVREQLGWSDLEPGCFAALRRDPAGAGKHWADELAGAAR